jgi:protein SCO1
MHTGSSSRRGPWGVGLAMAAVIVAVGVFASPASPPRFHGTTYTEVLPAAEIALTDHHGRPATLESFRGHPVLLFFGFTHCPDVCPLTLAKLVRAVEHAGRPARDARILLVTVDPERDTPEALRAYAARFGEKVLGLTGDTLALERARKGYGAYVVQAPPPGAHAGHAGHPAPEAGRTIHSSVVYGIDRRGDLRVVIPETATPGEMAADVRTLSRL